MKTFCFGKKVFQSQAKMGRKFFVGGNWKMNGSKSKIDEIIKNLHDESLSSETGLFEVTHS